MSSDLIASLHIMWKGMLGLFIVCGFISLLIMALNGIVKKTEKHKESQP